MKIAILSDFHGNQYATERVVDYCLERKIKHAFALGDYVGYYYRPELVLEQLDRFEMCAMIRGNHERLLRDSETDAEASATLLRRYGHGHASALERLSSASRQALYELPDQRSQTVDNVHFLLAHGSPFDPDEYVYPDSPAETFARLGSVDADVLLLGHTHHPLVTASCGTMIANPGSVGQPRDVGNLASFCVFDTSSRTVSPVRLQFETDGLLEEIARLDPGNEYLSRTLSRRALP